MEKIAEQVKIAEVNGFTGALIDAGFLKVASEEDAAVVAEIIAENLPEDYTMEDAMTIAAEIIEALEGEEVAEPEGEGGDMVVEASDKEGAQVDERALMAAYGELSMAKVAGDISEDEFEKEAGSIQSMIEAIRKGAKSAYTGSPTAGARAAKDATIRGASTFGRKLLGKDFRTSSAAAGEAKASGSAAMKKLTDKGIDVNGPMANRVANPLYDLKALIGSTKAAKNSELRKMLGAQAATAGAVGGAGLGAKSLYDKYSD